MLGLHMNNYCSNSTKLKLIKYEQYIWSIAIWSNPIHDVSGNESYKWLGVFGFLSKHKRYRRLHKYVYWNVHPLSLKWISSNKVAITCSMLNGSLWQNMNWKIATLLHTEETLTRLFTGTKLSIQNLEVFFFRPFTIKFWVVSGCNGLAVDWTIWQWILKNKNRCKEYFTKRMQMRVGSGH